MNMWNQSRQITKQCINKLASCLFILQLFIFSTSYCPNLTEIWQCIRLGPTKEEDKEKKWFYLLEVVHFNQWEDGVFNTVELYQCHSMVVGKEFKFLYLLARFLLKWSTKIILRTCGWDIRNVQCLWRWVDIIVILRSGALETM